jgi:glycosyltransferase involved in cell wall biosynthesis
VKVLVFINGLGLGGTEKAACRWAQGLKANGHEIQTLTLKEGPRRSELELAGVPVAVTEPSADAIASRLKAFSPDVIHAHVPGYSHEGDALGNAVASLSRKIPIVQTNVFGRLENPQEDAWTDFRLFISWTSCVQAARRSFRKLDETFFRRQSVAVYPLDVIDPVSAAEIGARRKQWGVADDEILFGRFSRPEPNKWTGLAIEAFQKALRTNRKIKLLLREPPAQVVEKLRALPEADHFIILPVTSDPAELRLTYSALDVVLHTSSIGESFGYGIAEPMALGKPVVTHSVPWGDQAQIELARPGECGFVTSTPKTMAEAIGRLAGDAGLRAKMGEAARQQIRTLADPRVSIARLETIFTAAIEKRDNPFRAEDLQRARDTAAHLDAHQFGHSLLEQIALRPFYYRVRFHELRKSLRLKRSR